MGSIYRVNVCVDDLSPKASTCCEGFVISNKPTTKLIQLLTNSFRREPHNDWLFREDDRRDEAFAAYLQVYLTEIAKKGATFIMSVEEDHTHGPGSHTRMHFAETPPYACHGVRAVAGS